MRTKNEMITESLAKPASNPTAPTPIVAYVMYSRDELLSVLGVQQPVNAKCRDLLAGVTNAGPGSEITVVREDLLTAFGVDWQAHDAQRAPQRREEPQTVTTRDTNDTASGEEDAELS